MAHKNYGGVTHNNTGYTNHTNVNSGGNGYAQNHQQYHQHYHNHTNTYDYHQSGGYSQSGYSVYNQYSNAYSNHSNYKEFYCYNCDRDDRSNIIYEVLNNKKTKKCIDYLEKNEINARGYYYSQSGYSVYRQYSNAYSNHTNYGNHTNYTDYHQSGYSNGYTQAYAQYNQSSGYNNHSNSGYTNHVNATTNIVPGNVANVNRGTSAYYKSTISLTWTAAVDEPTFPIETTPVAFQNGFTNWGSPWGPVKIWRTKDKTVYIRGLVNANPGPGKVLFNLPVGWRPTGGHLIFGSQEGDKHARINIENNGNVVFVNSKNPARSWLNVNLCFNADPNGWKDIPLMNRWVNYDANNGWQRARYKTTGLGVTFVEGLISGGTNGVVGQLPNGVGPGGRLIRLTDSTNETCRLDFIADGQIYIDMLGGNSGHTSITSCFLSKGRTDGWKVPGLQNGFTNYGGEYSQVKYNLLENGEVFIEGLINTGTNVNYNRIFESSEISPLNINIMVAGIKGGTTKDGSHGNLEHYPDGKISVLWPANNWHSMVHNYLKDTGTLAQQITYYIEYSFKPVGGSYGAWMRIVSGHGTNSYDYSLASHGNGHIKFRVLSSDGVETGSSWVESSEVRVLKYTTPSLPATNEKALAHEINFVKLEINKIASALGTVQASASTNINDIISKAGISSMRNAVKEASTLLDKSPVSDTNTDIIRKSDIDNLKNWIKSV